jgi:cation diffusion facilitator family transporter
MARSNISIYSALAANVAIAIAKFIAGGLTRSSAMIAEGVHSLVDTVNELLLLYGISRSNKERDKYHPFGYGRELYFWSFIVAILIFALGAGVSFVQGYIHLKTPAIDGPLTWNYAVLGFSLLSEGSSLVIAYRQFRKTATDQSLWAAIKTSKDPTNFMVLFEDGAAVLGILVVFALLYIGERTNNPYLDGVASLVVGCILTIASALLARESRSLLIGEGISARTEEEIKHIVEADSGGTTVKRIFSLYQSPEEVLLVLIIDFPPDLTTGELSDRMDRIKERIKGRYRKISYILIQPE